ncbi:BUD13 homolog [Pollicipes pollicipes]|uniref:BUD13 homolog n=1 Tax=Pollicipes pollicipes TaxID=41117 RepID=UPI001885864E|nr:BUD13 homolog [Pollicipes pollicipes]
MSSTTDQKEYLKKYLGTGKKKKKVKVPKGKGTRIVDDDAPAPAVAADNADDGLLDAPDERPQVAAVTSDAPPPGADKRWKTLDECDLEELESQREILSESLKMLEEEDVPRRKLLAGDEPPGAAATGRHDSDSSTRRASSPAGRADSDASPPRRGAGRRDSEEPSPTKRPRRRADSDGSPPRRRPAGGGKARADSDESPPRRKNGGKARADSDESPPRRKTGGKTRADSDESPPRRGGARTDSASKAESPAPPSRTQDGKRAGLQDVTALREENRAARRREQKTMAEMDSSLSGRNAETKIRGRKLQENKEKAAKKAEEEEKAKERKKKYDAWGKGLKQAEERRARVEDHLREANKPLARHADDADLEAELRGRQRKDDPMADYMQRKKAKVDGPVKARPRYNKTEPPPNRYNIWPGYRWDGVDRSSGFEKALFLRRNAKKAVELEAYKWSTEDM